MSQRLHLRKPDNVKNTDAIPFLSPLFLSQWYLTILRALKIMLLYPIIMSMLSCQKSETRVAATEEVLQIFHLISADSSGVVFNQNGSLLVPGDISGLYSNIAGMATGDINNDGLPDLFFSGGCGNSKLYLNKGNFQFEDITAKSGIRDANANNSDNQGVNFVDINADGLLDIYICKTGLGGDFSKGVFNKTGANLLYINQGNLTFKEEAKSFGLDIIGLSHTANFFDYDGDGDLDLYLIQTGEPGSTFSFGYYEAAPRFKWLSDRFYEQKNGFFEDVTQEVGIPLKRSIGLSVSVADVDRNGYQDIYVSNDFFGPDFFYLNTGKKKFLDRRNSYFSKTPMSAMGSDFADYNNDGFPDLFVGEMMPKGAKRQKTNLVPFSIEIYNKLSESDMAQYPRNMLFENKRGEQFSDIGMLNGLEATEWSWSSFFFDADNDGFKDLFVANGILRDLTNMDFVKDHIGSDYRDMADPEVKSKVNPGLAPTTNTRNYIFQNQGYGFTDQSIDWGLKEKAHVRGASFADLDNDGDLDLILNRIDQHPLIYRNGSELLDNSFVKFSVAGPKQNTFGIGATIEIYGDEVYQSNFISTQRGFQSSPEPIVHFGLGKQTRIDSAVVSWPGGKKEVFNNIESGKINHLKFGDGQALNSSENGVSTLFEKQTEVLASHRENSFDDFKQQRLLIRKYSRNGPSMAIGDLDNNGLDEMILGSASNAPLNILFDQNNAKTKGLETSPTQENAGILILDVNQDGLSDIFVANGGNELQGKNLNNELFINTGNGQFDKSNQGFLNDNMSSSTVNACDFDADGDLDLFVGSNIVSGEYAQLPTSFLYRNDNGQFSDATEELIPDLHNLGRVSSALWSDVNNDGLIDLIVAGEWMAMHVFQQSENGSFEKKIIPQSNGWWNSITGADIDNDGDIDYILGNHGLNSIFNASDKEPIRLVTADFDKNGTNDPVVFHYQDGENVPFVNRDLFTSHMPAFNNQYYSFKAYAEADYETLVNDQLTDSKTEEFINELRSCVFINDGDKGFRKIALPIESQKGPVYGTLTLDVNDDSFLDLILIGDDCRQHYEYGCTDALGGQILLGDGTGNFSKVDDAKSGFNFKGYGRALTYMEDETTNEVKILATSNNGDLQAFKLQGDLQVRRIPSNATHASIELENGLKRKQEFYYGQGYWTQLPRVLPIPKNVKALQFMQGSNAIPE